MLEQAIRKVANIIPAHKSNVIYYSDFVCDIDSGVYIKS